MMEEQEKYDHSAYELCDRFDIFAQIKIDQLTKAYQLAYEAHIKAMEILEQNEP